MPATRELIFVEAVNNKPKFPKFNSGAFLVNGKWINVSSDIDIRECQKNVTYDVLVETNPRGYQTVKQIYKMKDNETASQAVESVTVSSGTTPTVVTSTGTNKDARIARQGNYQAALQSPGVAAYSTSFEDFLVKVRAAADAGVAFTEGQ